MDARSDRDAALRDLARELYWAQERASRARMHTPEIRDRLHDLAAQLRADERRLIPLGEGNLASRSRWRRRAKHVLFRVLRPVSSRYDRLLADHAELSTGLAERLMAAEAELERLRSAGTGDDPDGGTPG